MMILTPLAGTSLAGDSYQRLLAMSECDLRRQQEYLGQFLIITTNSTTRTAFTTCIKKRCDKSELQIQDVFHHVAMHIGQPAVDSVLPECESLVVNSQ